MRGAVPFGGLTLTGNATTFALTTTHALFNIWGAISSDDTFTNGGETSVRPDRTNNRLLLHTPGTYLFWLNLSGVAASGCDVEAKVRKNGTAVADMVSTARWTTNRSQLNMHGIVSTLASDIASGTGVTSNAAVATTEYTGAGGFPKTLCPFDVTLACLASTDTLTVSDARFTAIRVG